MAGLLYRDIPVLIYVFNDEKPHQENIRLDVPLFQLVHDENGNYDVAGYKKQS